MITMLVLILLNLKSKVIKNMILGNGTAKPKVILVFIICLTFFSPKLSGQNMIGQSFSFISNYHHDSEYYLLPSETKNKNGKIHSLTYLHKIYKMELNYIFDENEQCQAYSISGDFIALDYLIKDFNTHYKKLSENEWLCLSKNGNYKITLSKNPSTYSFYYTLY
jgi:hypothetical protein